MYTGLIKMQDEATVHLFFHCCMKDGDFKDPELDNVSAKLVEFNLHAKLNFKDEMMKYRSYVNSIQDENHYLQYLVGLIKPVNELALFSYCAELCVADANLSLAEEQLLDKIAAILNLQQSDKELIKKLVVQRKVVETEKIF
jgi:Tellurite resistance protein TerB.